MIDLETIRFHGANLVRPECVLAHESGLLFVPDWTDMGGVAVVAPNGKVTRILARDRETPLKPNGIALEPGGSFLLAHMANDDGGLYRLYADGRSEAVLTEVDGVPIPPSNFPFIGADGTVWLAVSTRKIPRALGYNPTNSDGHIICLKDGRARIVADDIGYTNECIIHPNSAEMWVNETFSRRVSAYRLHADGSLSDRRTIVDADGLGEGIYPDGLAFDVDGNGYVISIVSNRVVRVTPGGRAEIILDDSDLAHVRTAEIAWAEGTMGRPHLDNIKGRQLKNISSMAFGGSDLRTAYFGCLLGEAIAVADLGVTGHKLPHWSVDLGPLAPLVEAA